MPAYRSAMTAPRPPAGHPALPSLQRLTAEHAPALLSFERDNRAYFAATIPDRGDAYFAHFPARHAALLADQAAGVCHFHVLVAPDGAILGRVNLVDVTDGLVDVADGSAELGYRIAERAAGQGLATAAVARIRARAAEEYALTTLRASTTLDNAASHHVLTRNGFVPTGPCTLGGRAGRRYVVRLQAGGAVPTISAKPPITRPPWESH